MAIYTPGPITGGISGNVGGVNFANPSGSKVVRSARPPSPNSSALQSLQASNMQNQILRWANLSELDKNAWRNAASQKLFTNRLGINRNLSGYQYFLKLNMHAEIDLPPLSTAQTPEASVKFSSTIANGLRITYNGVPVAVFYTGFIYGRLYYRTTKQKYASNLRKLGLNSTFGSATLSFNDIWDPVFKRPVIDQVLAIQYRPFAEQHDLGGWTTTIITTTA